MRYYCVVLCALLFFVTAVYGGVINDHFSRGDYDAVITHAIESKDTFTTSEWLQIAEAYQRKGDAYHALTVYRMLIEKKELFPNHVRIMWSLLGDEEKAEFVRYYFTTFGFDQELFYQYYFFARSHYRDDELAEIMETHYRSIEQAEMLDFLSNHFVVKGVAPQKIALYGQRHILTAFLAIASNDIDTFRIAFTAQNSNRQRILVQYCMRRKKKLILRDLYEKKLLTDKTDIALSDILHEGYTAASRYSFNTHEKRRLLTDLIEFEAIHDVRQLFMQWNDQEKAFEDIHGRMALSEKKYTEAFIAYYDWYKKTGLFDSALFKELIRLADFKDIASIRDDTFWMQCTGMFNANQDAETIVTIISLLTNDTNKATIIGSLIAKIPYDRFAPMIHALPSKIRVEQFADVMLDNADNALIDDISYLKMSNYVRKNEILGDIYFFLRNNETEAVRYYSAMANTRDKAYRFMLVHYVNRNIGGFTDTMKTVSQYHKASLLMQGDMLFLDGKESEALTRYTTFMEKTYSMWLKNDAQKRIYLYLTDKKALNVMLHAHEDMKNYLMWR